MANIKYRITVPKIGNGDSAPPEIRTKENGAYRPDTNESSWQIVSELENSFVVDILEFELIEDEDMEPPISANGTLELEE